MGHFEDLKDEARETLSHVWGFVRYDNREVTNYGNDFNCFDWNGMEFNTEDLETTLHFLFPE